MLEDQALYSRTNQITPEGSLTWDPTKTTATIEYSPEEQARRDQMYALTGGAKEQMFNFLGGPDMGYGSAFTPPSEDYSDVVKNLLGAYGGGGGGSGGASYGGFNVDKGPEDYAWELDLGSLPELPGVGDFGAERGRVEQALMDRSLNLMDPVFDRRRAAEAEMMANRGLTEFGEIAQLTRGETEDAYGKNLQRALQESIIGGGAEQSRLFDMASSARQQTLGDRLAQAGMTNQARQAAVGEASARAQAGLQSRSISNARMANNLSSALGFANLGLGQDQLRFAQDQASFAEKMGMNAQQFSQLASILGMGPGSQGMGGYWGPGQVDVVGAAGQDLNARQFAAANDPWNQMLGLAGSLGGAALGNASLFSSVDYKTEFETLDGDEVLEGVKKLEIPKWNYIGEITGRKHIGPMAEQFSEEFGTPMLGADGVVTIDAVSAVGVALKAIQALTNKVEELEKKLGG